MNKAISLLALMLLSACSQMDLQGQDPKDYFAKNPNQNKVASAQAEAVVLMPGTVLADEQIASLHHQLAQVRPMALESLLVESAHPLSAQKRAGLMRAFSKLGYDAPVSFDDGVDIAANEIRVSAAYATIISPDCPNWKSSPVTTYSNTPHSNFGCAINTNLGLMLEDPRDIERGSSGGRVTAHSERAADAVTNYRHGMTAPVPQAPVAGAAAGAAASPAGAMPVPGM